MTRARVIRVASTGVLTTILSFGHLIYSWWCSIHFYEWSGGIHKLTNGWTQFGGASYAWAIPLELPGAVTLGLCQLHTQSDCNGAFLGQLSMVLLLLAFVVTAYFISSVLVTVVARQQLSLGRFHF